PRQRLAARRGHAWLLAGELSQRPEGKPVEERPHAPADQAGAEIVHDAELRVGRPQAMAPGEAGEVEPVRRELVGVEIEHRRTPGRVDIGQGTLQEATRQEAEVTP